MLQYQPNIERMFHHALLDAIPLLFLAPEDYRNALAKEFDALYYQYRSGGSEVQITDGIDTITKMMVGAGDHWGSRTKDQIRVFRSMWQGFDERIAALERRIVTRKPKRKIKKPDVIAEPGTVPEPVNIKKNQTEQVLQYITEHPGETSREIAIGVGIVARSCDNALSWLQRKAVIRKEGERKRYRYYGTETTGVLNIMEDYPDLFCNRCHRLLSNSHSDYCKECRKDIRNKNQAIRREINRRPEVKQLEYCAGGCGKELSGKQRVWCGGPECWLKIYRKKKVNSPASFEGR